MAQPNCDWWWLIKEPSKSWTSPFLWDVWKGQMGRGSVQCELVMGLCWALVALQDLAVDILQVTSGMLSAMALWAFTLFSTKPSGYFGSVLQDGNKRLKHHLVQFFVPVLKTQQCPFLVSCVPRVNCSLTSTEIIYFIILEKHPTKTKKTQNLTKT